MILPTKHILIRDSLLGVGAELLRKLAEPCTVSDFWTKSRSVHDMTYKRFVMALDLLYLIGAVDFSDGKIRRMTCSIH